MTPQKWARIAEVFDAAVSLDAAERPAIIEKLANGDVFVQDEALRLLNEHDQLGDFLEPPARSEITGSISQHLTTFNPGDLVGDRYEICNFLARGGMGEVYEVKDHALEEVVALKTLRAGAVSTGMQARFKREILLARRITHRNVCRIHDLGRHVDSSGQGLTFLTMEFIRGETLASRIKRLGPFPLNEAEDIVLQMVDGLAAAHRLGIIHRDFKSGNVILIEGQSERIVKITDFGLARYESVTEQEGLTRPGQFLGTPAYAPPEQFRGIATKASDIYALGVVMYEMIVGVRPFRAGDVRYDQATCTPDESISHLEPRWRDTILKCLESDPARRFAAVQDVATALDHPQEPPGIQTPSISPAVTSTRTWSRRHQLWVFAALLLLLLTTFFILRNRASIFGPQLPEQKHIAVLPFRNIGNEPMNQAFCDGIAETLTGKLSQLEKYQKSFWVIPSDETALKTVTVENAYRELNVTLVVSGSIQRTAKGIVLVANLIDARAHKQLDSRPIRATQSELPELQNSVWELVADMIDLQVDRSVAASVNAGGTKVPAAFDFYEQGVGYVKRHGLENFDLAIQCFTNALQKDSKYALAYAGLSEAYSKKYELTKDTRWISEAIRNGDTALSLNSELAPVHLALAQVYIRIGKSDAAIRELRSVLEMDPGAVDAYFYLGRIYEERGMLPEAEENFKTVVNHRPGYWLGHSGLGYFYFGHGKIDEAIEQFKIIIALQPDNPLGYENLSGAYEGEGEPGKAVDLLTHMPIKPTYSSYSNLGTAYLFLNRYSEAAEALKKAVDLNPSDHEVWRNLADSYSVVPKLASQAPGAYRRALELANKRLQVDPNDDAAISAVALYEAHLGQEAAARAAILKALKYAPSNANVVFTSALIYEMMGHRAEALSAIESAHKLGYPLYAINGDPELIDLRRDGRFGAWLKTIR